MSSVCKPLRIAYFKRQMAGQNSKRGILAENETSTYQATTKGKKMALDWPYIM
jgi:hypothetical protein